MVTHLCGFHGLTSRYTPVDTCQGYQHDYNHIIDEMDEYRDIQTAHTGHVMQ
jgi:hypothetical protein